jgi:uncharacterized integral membrane protein (TIGR00698 family)
MNIVRQNIIGATTILSLVVFSILLSHFLSSINILISSAFLCIFFGLIVGNIFSLKKIEPFANFCLKKLLRIGIALLGLSLSLNELFNYGLTAFFLIIINIIIAFLIIKYLCNLFKIPNVLGYLITMGTCICGVTAVIATSSIMKTDKDQTSYAVGVVTLFGIIAVFFYPYVANYYFHFSPDLAGIFLGTAIHDTAQVSAASVIYSDLYNSEEALNSAITTKLLRNSFLILLIPLIGYLYKKEKKVDVKNSIKEFFPTFVLGFILLSFLRTIGDHLFLDNDIIDYWKYSLVFFKEISIYCILFSMVAIGLQTNIKSIINLGFKPLIIGFIASAIVGAVSVIYLY